MQILSLQTFSLLKPGVRFIIYENCQKVGLGTISAIVTPKFNNEERVGGIICTTDEFGPEVTFFFVLQDERYTNLPSWQYMRTLRKNDSSLYETRNTDPLYSFSFDIKENVIEKV